MGERGPPDMCNTGFMGDNNELVLGSNQPLWRETAVIEMNHYDDNGHLSAG